MSVRSAIVLLLVAVAAAATWLLFAQRGNPESPVLGPADGYDLPPTDLERVAVGDVAPDFSLTALSGEVLTLSDFRGAKNTVLVFYRGH
ncbi:MAG: hypothetical protein AMS18_09985, partial [Gemmatimonas sp. SG8_17]